MVSQLTVGVNTYATLAEADAYLANSIRAASNWRSVAPDTKAQSLISAFRLFEKQFWQGTTAAVQIVNTVAISSGGSSYAVNDVLTIAGGTFGYAARVQVTSVSSGVITGLALIDAGSYSADDLPTTPNSATGGSGSSASITLTFTDQTATHPRTGLTDCYGTAIEDMVIAGDIQSAQIELAYELSQDSAIETASNTGSNIKRAGAGSAQIEFFRATNGSGESGRFPTVVMELIKCFTGAGTQASSGAIASGVDACSQFDDADRYDLRDGAGFP